MQSLLMANFFLLTCIEHITSQTVYSLDVLLDILIQMSLSKHIYLADCQHGASALHFEFVLYKCQQ